MTTPLRVVVLGATGVMGSHEVERLAGDERCEVVALAAAGTNLNLLAYQAIELGVHGVAVGESDLTAVHAAFDAANEELGSNVRPEILIGQQTTTQAAGAGVDLVINAIAGSGGLAPSLAALRSGARLRVANTDTLLAADLLRAELPEGEHLRDRLTLLNPAVAGLLDGDEDAQITSVALLTRTPRAARRPTKETVDAQTGIGAGLTMLELRALTDAPITLWRHDGPITAIGELADGRSLLLADHTLRRPARSWDFEEATSPGFDLAVATAHQGGTYPLVLHAANTIAAHAHLEGAIPLAGVIGVVAEVLDRHEDPGLSEASAHASALWAKEQARTIIAARR